MHIRDLGVLPYPKSVEAMQAFVNARTPQTPDELWCVEHPATFTQGQAGKEEHLLSLGDIPLVQSDRGGQVTYHGPGQLVIYCLLDLKRLGLTTAQLVRTLEQALIALLADYGVHGLQRPGAPGIYVDDAKIAFIGLRIRRGYSYHGISLNVDMDLEPFSRIHPCGYPDLAVTQLRQFKSDVSIKKVQEDLLCHLVSHLGYTDK